MPEALYGFSAFIIGAAYARQIPRFGDLADRLGMDVTELMRECNGIAPPSKVLVKRLARELGDDPITAMANTRTPLCLCGLHFHWVGVTS
jgi:transcriptional regulator with XRE-family HTH domain